MARTTCVFVTLLALALARLLMAGAEPEAPANDKFDDPFDKRLAAGWSWVREDKDHWRVADGTLEVRLTPGNLWEKENTARNLLLRDAPVGGKPFAAEVTVSHTPAVFGEQAGLLWYRDDDNYIKLVKEFYDGRTWAVFAAERGGKAEYHEADCRAQWVTLRLTVDGDKVSGEFRPVGGTGWKQIGDFDFPARDKAGGRARIGLTAHHGPADAERWAHFREFKVSRPD